MSDSRVEISIVVVDQNGTEAVKKLNTELAAVGEAGATAGAQAASGLEKIGGHALTSLDNVRLLRDDLGIRIPRSMERAIAQSELLSGAIGSIGTGLLALGAVEIFTRMGESLYNAYEKYVDLNAAAKEYSEQLAKSKDEDFINPRSIETAVARIHEAQQAVVDFHQIAQDNSRAGWEGLFPSMASGNMYGMASSAGQILDARQMEDQSYKSKAQADALQTQQLSLTHELTLAQIELNAEKSKTGQADHDDLVELQQKLNVNLENARYEKEMAGQHGNTVDANAGVAKTLAADQLAIAQYQNQRRGEADRQAKEAQEQMKRAIETQADLDARATKATADAAVAGLTGISRIQAEAHAALVEIDAQEKKAASTTKGGETDAQRAAFEKQRAAAAATADQKIAESQQTYFEEMDRMQEQFVTSSTEGYARIGEEAQKAAERAEDAFKKQAAGMAATDPLYIADWTKLQQTLTEIEQGAERERRRLHTETMDSLRKEEEATARDLLPPWLAEELAIEQTYQDRVHKAQQALAQQKTDQTEYNADILAANASLQAQLEKQNEETRDKMASQMSELFKNPTKFIETKALDAGFQFMSNEMLKIMQQSPNNPITGAMGWLFGMNGNPSTSTNPMDFGKSLLGMNHGAAGTATMSTAASTLQTGSTTLLTAAQTLQTAATNMMAGGGGLGIGGAGGGLGTLGFGGASSGFGSSTGNTVDVMPGAGEGGADAMNPLAGPTGAAGGLQSMFGGGDLMASTAGTAQAVGGLGGKYLGAAAGAVTGGLGILSAYQNSNPLAGAISGAEAGASLGSIIPGVGTAVGAVVGAVGGLLAGIFGDQGKGQAQTYDTDTIQPGVANELRMFNSGSTGYDQAAQYFDQLTITAQAQTKGWGRGATNWCTASILPEIQAAQQQIAQEEKGGRSLVGLNAAQYHAGGYINDFGDLATGPDEGFIHAQRGEKMLTPLQASSYATGGGSTSMVPASSAGAGHTYNITAWDAASVATWMRNGGATQIRQGLNAATGQYGGLGIR